MVPVTDDNNPAGNEGYDEVTGPWLTPGEALTRFVPAGTTQGPGARNLAPIRFGFRVGSLGLLVPAGMLSELVEETEVYPLPTTPAWFRGLINLRGGLVPVFDLKTLFALGGGDGEKRSLLVLNAGPQAVSVLIDGLPLTVDTGQRLAQPPPLPPVLREHSQGVYVRKQEVWVDFDFDGFFRAAVTLIVA